MNPFERKSIFVWNSPAAAPILAANGFEAVLLHGQNIAAFRSLHTRAEVEAYHAAGLAVAGSIAVYGYDPAGDGRACANICKDYNLDGLAVDIEGTFERQTTPDSRAAKMLIAYREIVPDLPTAWCTWPRFWRPRDGQSWHPVSVMQTAMKYCDYGMPMVYSPDLDTVGGVLDLLAQSLAQWRKYTDKPLVIAGRAYDGEGYTAKADQVKALAEAARFAGCPGMTWWEFGRTIQLPAIWQAVKDVPGFAQPAPPPEPEPSQLDRIEASQARIEARLAELLKLRA
jgi:hypothetical protein